MFARRLLLTVPMAAAGLLILAGPASAHISVDPAKIARSAEVVELTFHVPNESDTASTNKIDMQMPTATPFGLVLVADAPGWTYATTTKTLDNPITTDEGAVTDVIDTISWSGGTIAPGAYQDFSILVGPIPHDVTSLSFPTVQTYDDGTTVSWIEVPTAGGTEPDHPAPTVEVAAPAGSGGGSSSSTKTLAIGDGLLAVIALGIGMFLLIKRGRGTSY